MNFDEMTERRGTDSSKWDNMQAFSGVDRKSTRLNSSHLN